MAKPAHRAGPRIHPDGPSWDPVAAVLAERFEVVGSTCRATAAPPASAPTSRRPRPPSARPGARRLRGLLAGRPPVPAPGPRPARGRATRWCWSARRRGCRRRRRAGRPQGGRRRAGRRDRARSGPTAFLERLAAPAHVRHRCTPTPTTWRPAGPTPRRAWPTPLRRLGTGAQEPLWDRLGDLGDAGAGRGRRVDAKFTEPGRADGRGRRRQRPVVALAGAGHAAHLERPELFCRRLGRCFIAA